MVVGGTVTDGGNVASSKNEQRQAREARERLRRFTARQSVHAHQRRRRRRDNVLAIAGVAVVIALATATQVFFFTAGPGATTAATPSPSPSSSAQANVGAIPAASLAENRQWTGSITLNDVKLGITLDGTKAPQAVAVFVQEVRDRYFTGKVCHRLTDTGSSLIQCGSTDGTGKSDADFSFGPIENAPEDGTYPAGTIAMARTADNAYSQGHQFFIMYEDGTLPADSAGGYTVFGHVTSGLDRFISEIASGGVVPGGPRGDHDGTPAIPTTITAVSIE
jgi:peptidyl-prolyl cis-trans isomerase B (cyclophilin B)